MNEGQTVLVGLPGGQGFPNEDFIQASYGEETWLGEALMHSSPL